MKDSKIIETPIRTSSKIDNDEFGSSVNETIYRRIIGSLLYLTVSRIDIIFNVGMYARFQDCPKESHLKVVK